MGVSHYYFCITVAPLIILLLAILPEIYRDRSNHWPKVHIASSCLALLSFLGQAATGTRDLLEMPLDWQKFYLCRCDFNQACSAPIPSSQQLTPIVVTSRRTP